MRPQYPSQTSARLATLILRELAYRGGKCKLRYLKVYRTIEEWGGEEYASYIISRLREGGFIRVEGDYVVLAAQGIRPERPERLMAEARRELMAMGNA